MLIHGTIDDQELHLIEARCSMASAAPWWSWVAGRDMEAGLSFIECATGESFELIGATTADQDFIARAREDIPRLIAEIRALLSNSSA